MGAAGQLLIRWGGQVYRNSADGGLSWKADAIISFSVLCAHNLLVAKLIVINAVTGLSARNPTIRQVILVSENNRRSGPVGAILALTLCDQGACLWRLPLYGPERLR